MGAVVIVLTQTKRGRIMGGNGKINAAERERIGKVADALAGHFVDRGLIIEMGFASMIEATYPDWRDMPAHQKDDLRAAFFAGAQHLFGSIMSFLDPGAEPTNRDMVRMEKIVHELDAFIRDYAKRHNIEDAVGSKPETPQ